MSFAEIAKEISSEFKFDEHAWEAVAEHAAPTDASIGACSNHLDEQFMAELNSYAYLTPEFIVA